MVNMAPLSIMASATASSSAMDAGTLCEFSTAQPAHPVATRTNLLHAEFEVVDVHAAKQMQTRPGHAILNRTHDKIKDLPFQKRSVLVSETLTIRHTGCQIPQDACNCQPPRWSRQKVT